MNMKKSNKSLEKTKKMTEVIEVKGLTEQTVVTDLEETETEIMTEAIGMDKL